MSRFTLPLVAAFLAFLSGLLIGLRVPEIPPAVALAALPLLAGVLLHRRATGRSLRPAATQRVLLAALALAGAGNGAAGRLAAARDCRATLADGAPLAVAGALAADFAPPADPRDRIPLLPVQVAHARSSRGAVAECQVEMRVRLPRDAAALHAGSELRVAGEWRLMPAPVERGAWPQAPTYRGYLLARQVRVAAAPSFARHPLLAMRGRAERQVRRLFGARAPLAEALVLGRRETLDRALSDRFAQAGLVHLLAISGTHVALVAAVLVLLGSIARLPRDRVAWLSILLVWLYLAVIGAPPSAVRSGIMVSLALLSRVMQRPSATLPIIAAAALAILAAQPMAALDAGFQLSFAGVMGIVVLRAPILHRIPLSWRRGKVRRPLAESMAVSLAAFVATAPVTAQVFGQVAPVSIAANLPAIPLSSLALVGIGAACAVEPVAPPVARLLADGAGAALDLLQKVVDAAAAVPGGHAAVAPPQWWLWAATALAFLLALDAAGRLRSRVRWVVAGGTATAAFVALPLAASPAGGLDIAFLDVGQGDAVAIHTPAGRWLLVDAGPVEDGYNAGEKRVLPYLRAHGASGVETMVLTHPHNDHIGGAAAVMHGMHVGTLVEPGLAFGTPVYLGTLQAARQEHVAWTAARQDRTLRIDGLELTFLWPTVDVLDAPADANDISAVVLLRYGSFTALLTGDAPAEVEHALVARYGAGLHAQVLKAGHHGSRTATSPELLRTVHPALAVISCGRRNKFGHPAPEVVQRLREGGVQVARTDEDGTVVVHVAPDGAWEREEP